MPRIRKAEPQPQSRAPRVAPRKACIVGITYTAAAAFLTYEMAPTLVLKFGSYFLFLLPLLVVVPWLRYMLTNPFPGGMSVAEFNDVLTWPIGKLIRKYGKQPRRQLDPKRDREKDYAEPIVVSEFAGHCIGLYATIPLAGMFFEAIVIEGAMTALVGGLALLVWIIGLSVRYWMFKPWRNGLAAEQALLALTWPISPWVRPRDKDGVSW